MITTALSQKSLIIWELVLSAPADPFYLRTIFIFYIYIFQDFTSTQDYPGYTFNILNIKSVTYSTLSTRP